MYLILLFLMIQPVQWSLKVSDQRLTCNTNFGSENCYLSIDVKWTAPEDTDPVLRIVAETFGRGDIETREIDLSGTRGTETVTYDLVSFNEGPCECYAMIIFHIFLKDGHGEDSVGHGSVEQVFVHSLYHSIPCEHQE